MGVDVGGYDSRLRSLLSDSGFRDSYCAEFLLLLRQSVWSLRLPFGLEDAILSWRLGDDIHEGTVFPDFCLGDGVDGCMGECFCVTAKGFRTHKGKRSSVSKEALSIYRKRLQDIGTVRSKADLWLDLQAFDGFLSSLPSTDYFMTGNSTYDCLSSCFVSDDTASQSLYDYKQELLSNYRRDRSFQDGFCFCIHFLEQGLFMRNCFTGSVEAYHLMDDKLLLQYIYEHNPGDLDYILFLYHPMYKGHYGGIYDFDFIVVDDIPRIIDKLPDFSIYGCANGLDTIR